MTRASFSLDEEKIVVSTPSAPVSVHVQKRAETEGSSSMNDESYERLDDEKSGRTRRCCLSSSWQQNGVEDGVDRTKSARNETMRAQYEIHSRE